MTLATVTKNRHSRRSGATTSRRCRTTCFYRAVCRPAPKLAHRPAEPRAVRPACGRLPDLDEIAAEDAFWADMPIVDDLARGPARFHCHYPRFLPARIRHPQRELPHAHTLEGVREAVPGAAAGAVDAGRATKTCAEPFVIRLEPLHRSARLFSKSMGPASALGKYIKHMANQKGLDLDLNEASAIAISFSS